MKKAIFAMLAMAAAVFAQSALAETVEIASAADWAAFAGRVNGGATALDAVMTADVTLTQDSPRVGTDGNPYGGAFDGLGHRLTLNWNLPGVDFAAPFAYVAGAGGFRGPVCIRRRRRNFQSPHVREHHHGQAFHIRAGRRRETSRHHDFQLSVVRRNHKQLFRGHYGRWIHVQNDPGGRYQDRQLPF